MAAGASEVSRARRRLARRRWPLMATVLVIATGMGYSLLWGPVVRHQPTWLPAGDIWGTFRSAQYIAWGSLGSVYAAGTALVTFPGILLLLAPVAVVTDHFGMTESFPYSLPHPTAWLVLGPYEMALGCAAVFACDALAERLGASGRRRAVLALAEGAAVWPLLVFWGHPEDAVALAFALYSVVLALDGRWSGAGWLFGAAVATQPLVLLALPVLLAVAGRSRVAGIAVRALAPSAVLLATPLAYSFHDTVQALVTQPNYPGIDHPTPWTSFAPWVSGHGKGLVVAGGPGRVVAAVAACGLGWWARRWRGRPEMVVWALALAMALRCFTESVMDSFYLFPALALCLVAVAGRAGRRPFVAIPLTLAVTVVAEHRFAGWVTWWTAVSSGLALALVLAWPGRPSRLRDEVPIPDSAAGQEPLTGPRPVLAGAHR